MAGFAMDGSKTIGIMTGSFFDGVTGAALFGKLRRPGAPAVFCSSEAEQPLSATQMSRICNDLAVLRGQGFEPGHVTTLGSLETMTARVR